MLKVLINSYTCCPGMGSEQGMGWNWIVNLARHCELYVISEGEYREQCEEGTKGLPVHWYWNPVPQSTREKCWNQGNWSFYPLYAKWQRRTAEIAREIVKEVRIDVMHQLNMIGFREPGYLYEVARETGIPLVWGPVDAKEGFPMAYTNGASMKMKAFLKLKNSITRWQLAHSKRVKEMVRVSKCVVSASSNSQSSFRKYMGIESVLINETGCSVVEGEETLHCRESFNVLWVGKMDFRKQLGLALSAVANAGVENMRLNIVGGGDSAAYKQEAERLWIGERITWSGVVSHEEVQRLMREADVLLFTSVAEGTPHVVLEAMANGLPVICFDTCGQGDSVTCECGIKIKLTNPGQSVRDFAEALKALYEERERLREMSGACRERARELSWEKKAEQMVELYKKATKI